MRLSIPRRFSAAVAGQGSFTSSTDSNEEGGDPEERGSTEPPNRLSHLLKTLAKVSHTVLEPYAKDWVPLFLEYARAGKAGQAHHQEQQAAAAVAAKGAAGG
jgi:U3 small nucleolar RNA-associated protein 20